MSTSAQVWESKMSTENMNGKKILLIDDDLDSLRLTSLIFNQTGAQVIITPNGLEAMGKLFTQQPDLIILDAMMPGIDGFKICRRIRQYTNTPLIMLSALDHDELMLKGLEAGADDFLSKPVNPDILVARAKAVLRRSEINNVYQEMLGYKDSRLEIDMERHRVLIGGKPVKLTPVEFRMLAYLASNAGKVISYEDILFGVWSADHKGKYGYVHVYISNLRNKIEEDPKNPAYIRSVHKVGYIFEKQSQATVV
jgi:DNA-binding response OmpR family regulator